MPRVRTGTPDRIVVPWSGHEFLRGALASQGVEFFPFELLVTKDQMRVFVVHDDSATCTVLNNVYHGDVASEAAMLALAASDRGCWPGDTVRRTDLGPAPGTVMRCISGHGETVTDWIPLNSGVEGGGSMTGEEIVAAIDAELGSTAWRTGGGSFNAITTQIFS